MKKLTVLLYFVVAVLITANVQAQNLSIPKSTDLKNVTSLVLPADKAGFEKDFLAALDPGSDLGIPADKLTKLIGGNKNLVNSVMGILGGSGSNESKLSNLTSKNKEWKTAVKGLLGDSTAGKYFTKVDKQLQAFKSKYQVAKLFL